MPPVFYGRSVATKATAGEVQDDKQQEQDDDDDPKHFHPAWCAGGRSAFRAPREFATWLFLPEYKL